MNYFTKAIFCGFLLLLVATSEIYAAEKQDIDLPNGLPDHIVGDLGFAAYSSKLNIGATGAQTTVLPYGFFDYKRFAMRIDQLAFKTVPIGYGFLEIAGKVDLNSYKVKSTINSQIINKGDPAPIGLGTFQDTPVGAFFINAYRDFGQSKGSLLEFNYFGEMELGGKVTLYPQFGIERQSNAFANYYYSITPDQALLTGYRAYTASSANNPLAGFLLEIPVVENWYLNLYGRRKWLGSGVSGSPVLARSFQDTMFMSLAYRFK